MLVFPSNFIDFLFMMIKFEVLLKFDKFHQTQPKLLWHCNHWKTMMSSFVLGSRIYHSLSKISFFIIFC